MNLSPKNLVQQKQIFKNLNFIAKSSYKKICTTKIKPHMTDNPILETLDQAISKKSKV